MKHRCVLAASTLAPLFLVAATDTHAVGPQSVVLAPSKDNTLIEIADGSVSAALTEFVFVGRVGNHGGGAKLRRGLIQFDVAGSLPAGATITAVTLDVFCVMTNSEDQPMGLHRTLQAWGEGTSFSTGGAGSPATPGDATWLHNHWPDQFWSTEGGSFEPSASCTTIIALPGAYQWPSTLGLVADAQTWLDDPASNFGWTMIGNEPIVQSVKGLASRENAVVELRPRLTIEFLAPIGDPGDLDGDGVVDGADLGMLLAAWGRCPAPPRVCTGDIDGSGEVDGADLGALLAGWAR